MKTILLLLVLSFSVHSYEVKLEKKDVAKLLFEQQIVGRDSGSEVTIEFLQGCLSNQSETLYVLECDDVLFKHYISSFAGDDYFTILITEDGASVENRWVYFWRRSLTAKRMYGVWPDISDEIISALLTTAMGDKKYSADYIQSVAHSSYRIIHGANNTLTVISGIPDESYGVKLGVIQWAGVQFTFLPKYS